jgi:hypothetical protein
MKFKGKVGGNYNLEAYNASLGGNYKHEKRTN